MKMNHFSTYEEAIEFLLQAVDYEKLTNYTYDVSNFNLKRMEKLLSAIGNPHKRGTYVHITGTKGKGSTAIMIASALKESGLKTGLFTSPHLVYLGERMKVNDEMIPQEMLMQLVNELKPYIERERFREITHSPTFFDTITAIALTYFERKKVDISVLEVGMGGRLDSTNVVLPQISIITPISYDHTNTLGHTLEKIAYEKSGIIKEGIPVVSSIQEHEAMSIISKTCKEKKARLRLVGRDILITDIKKARRDGFYGTECMISTWRNKYRNIFLPLIGQHQVENCATAIGALETLSENGAIKIDNEAVINALAKIKCPARIEVVSTKPLIILDTAHTVSSMKFLRESIKENFTFKRLILIIGLSADKDILQRTNGY
ncbi:MAG: bifunctional folylpolyglutamate synthase/dihydrofolate synthase [Planctomycetota bacterium]|jgi:dihydrofolate synthase/folylpolyglutamate synthase